MPAPVPAVGDILEVKNYTLSFNQLGLNVLHYRVVSVGGAGLGLDTVASLLGARWSAEYQACMTNNANYRGTGVQIVASPAGVSPAYLSASGAGAGIAGTPGLPLQTSGIISLRTSLAGRRQRGRVYIPFPADADLDTDDTPKASYVTRLTTLAGLFGTNFTLASGGDSLDLWMSIYHRATSTGSDVETLTPQKLWATQRRRSSFGRTNVSPI